MSRVLIPGLAVGKDVGVCAACNFDFELVLFYPAMLAWSEKIVLTPTMADKLCLGESPDGVPEIGESSKLVFQLASDAGAIDVCDPSRVITPQVANLVWKQAEADRSLLASTFPKDVTVDSAHLFINGIDYCLPYIASLYSTLLLAAAWDTQVFLDDRALTYWRHRFGSISPNVSAPLQADGFQSVFESHLPNDPLVSRFLACSKLDRDKLERCGNRQKCHDEHLRRIEKQVSMVLAWRDYEEVHQLREVVDRIIRERESGALPLDAADVSRSLDETRTTLNRRIRFAFPKVTRWADIVTMLSVPVAIAGAMAGSPSLIYTGASLAGLGQVGKVAIDVLKSQYRWVGFRPKQGEENKSGDEKGQ